MPEVLAGWENPSQRLVPTSRAGRPASGSKPGVEPTTPPPAGFFPPLLREGVAAERNDDWAAHHIAGDTTASRDGSNSFWAISINCFFRLPILPLWPICGSS
jgi:hypothetical protein